MNTYRLQRTSTPAHATSAQVRQVGTCTAGTMAQAVRRLYRAHGVPMAQARALGYAVVFVPPPPPPPAPAPAPATIPTTTEETTDAN